VEKNQPARAWAGRLWGRAAVARAQAHAPGWPVRVLLRVVRVGWVMCLPYLLRVAYKRKTPRRCRCGVSSNRGVCCLRAGPSRTGGRGNKYKDEERCTDARRRGRCDQFGIRGGVALQHAIEKNMRAKVCQAIGGKNLCRGCNGCSGNKITAVK